MSKHHRSRTILALSFGAVCLLAVFLGLLRPTVAKTFSDDPLTAAWERAQAAGSYRFTSDVVQITIPAPTISNVGRSSRTEQLYLEGQSDLDAAALEFQLWTEGGSVHDPASGIAVRAAEGKSYVRQGTGDWEESSSFSDVIAPEGDFMAYLAAARDITAHEPETRAGITFTRYSFQIDGPTFAAFTRKQMEAAMRARGELPDGVHFEVSSYYHNMTGDGELWVRENGLPLRQVLNIQFPEQSDESVRAQIKVDFSHFGQTRYAGGVFVQVDPVAGAGSAMSFAGFSNIVQRQAPAFGSFLALLSIMGLAVLMVAYRRRHTLQVALSLAVIASMLVGPILNTLHLTSFLDTQKAHAAEQSAAQAESALQRDLRALDTAPQFNPHQNPLGVSAAVPGLAPSMAVGAASVSAPILQATNVLTVETGLDTDGDGLTDFVEQRIGTSEIFSDTDGDLILDNVEVNGFTLNGKEWYPNPLELDSNGDSVADTLEYDIDSNSQPDDTDGDGVPDLFDNDNDGDGVADHVDLAPFAKSSFYGEPNPLLLKIENLTGNNSSNAVPTFVDFQVRPESAEQLQFAFNPLDWPQDDKGQIKDVDNQPADMKLLPMLEIRIPNGAAMLPPQSDLDPYQIAVSNGEAIGEKVAYLPLTPVTDSKSGERVAFGGRMRYLPQAAWQSQSVRMVWMVQMANDAVCDYEKQEDRDNGCTPKGYFLNRGQIIHRYYESWQVTGLNVSEEHGAKTAVIYEDPSANRDPQPGDDSPTWFLSNVLEERFLKPAASGAITMDNIASKLDWNTVGAGNAETIYGLPNHFKVTPVQTDPTFDSAINGLSTVISDTILPAFSSADKPLLMFVYETSVRSVGLDISRINGSYAAFSGDELTIRFNPSGQDNTQIDTLAGFKWNPYCSTGGSPSWAICDAESYWQELETRYGDQYLDPETLTAVSKSDQDPDVARAMMLVTQLYALTVQQGLSNIVRQDYGGNDIRTVSGLNPAESDSEVEAYVRDGLKVGAGAAKAAANELVLRQFKKAVSDNPAPRNQKINAYYKNILAVDKQGTFSYVKSSAFRSAGTAVLLIGTLVAVGLSVAGYEEAGEAASIAVGVGQVTLSVLSPLRMTNVASTLAKAAPGPGVQGPTNISKVSSGSAESLGYTKMAAKAGLVLAVGITWGFFIYSIVSNNVAVGSPEFNSALAETIAATILIILLTILALTGVGLIIVGIITAIDVILTLICKFAPGGEALETGFTGGCFTLSGAATKVIAKALYNYELMINTSRQDLVSFGAPDVALATPILGYVEDNELSITLPITTHAVYKDPEVESGFYINFYLWLFSKDNLRSSTFKYSATANEEKISNVERFQIKSDWFKVREDHKYVLTPMYGGFYTTTVTVDNVALQAGLNQPAKFYHNMGFAIPAYECWVVPVPLAVSPVTPICYTRTFKSNTSEPVDTIVFDIFPASLSQFITTGTGLTWDPAFRPLQDADGDGLLARRYGGLDPDDTMWDADNDGLADSFELEQQQVGVNLSPTQKFSDGDGLTDAQELRFGTNPAVADTDNDGLLDHEEVWHEVYDLQTGNATGIYTGGLSVLINAPTAFTVRVSSNPNSSDSDGDGLSDGAEYQLAQDTRIDENGKPYRLDENNVPYHPNVVNAPPVRFFLTNNAALNRYVTPGQQFVYTTTVIATTPLDPGVLDVDASNWLGVASQRFELPFDPLTFSTAQTLTQQISFTVAADAPTNTSISVNNTVRTQLEGSGLGPWEWTEFGESWNLADLSGDQEFPRFVSLAPSTPSRQDAYAMVADARVIPSNPEMRMIAAQSTQTGLAATALDTFKSKNINHNDGADVACNDSGNCMYVWEVEIQCTTATINSLKVVQEGPDGGSGIEPVIFIRRNHWDSAEPWSNVNATTASAGYELLWDAKSNSSNNLDKDQVVDSSAKGFPIDFTICDGEEIVVFESDNQDNIVTTVDWPKQFLAGRTTLPADGYWTDADRTVDITFAPNETVVADAVSDHVCGGPVPQGATTIVWRECKIELNITKGRTQVYGGIGRTYDATGAFLSNAVLFDNLPDANFGYRELHNPVVASDGEQFLVAWERLFVDSTALNTVQQSIVTYDFDSIGVALGDGRQFELDASEVTRPRYFTPGEGTNAQAHSRANLDIEWLGDRYRIARQFVGDSASFNTVSAFDVEQSGIPFSANPIPFALTTSVGSTGRHAFDLAYDPVNNRSLLVYLAQGAAVGARLFTANGAATAISIPSGTSNNNPQVVYNPVTKGWLVSWEKTNQQHYLPLKANGAPLMTVSPQPTNQAFRSNSGALACPLPASVPVVDLRFEELPGATGFADRSGYGNSASCTDNTCPAPGAEGAPDAPLSAYALEFNDANDRVVLTKPSRLSSSLSLAIWYKANQSSFASAPFVIESNQPSGFGLFVRNNQDQVEWHVANKSMLRAAIADNQWHFIVGTYDRNSGAVNLYVDGNRVGQGTTATQVPNLGANIEIRGADNLVSLDHLQIYPSALSASSVSDLFARSNNGYCAAARANASTVPWSKLQLQRQETFTPIKTSAASLITVDSDAPTASVTGAQYVEIDGSGSAILTIGGAAQDTTSGVGSVAVSVNGSAFESAKGRESWVYQFPISEGSYTIQAKATDILGNVGNASNAKVIIADATPPQVTINAITNPVKPVLNGDGNWQVSLSGTANDPAIGQLPGSGIYTDSVQVLLTGAGGPAVSDQWQTAAYNENNQSWMVDYVFPAARIDVNGSYTVSVRAEDRAGSNGGNNTGDSGATASLQLAHIGPTAALSTIDAARQFITEPVTIGGPVISPNSGIAKVEVAFATVEQIAALGSNVSAEDAQTQLDTDDPNRWLPAALVQQDAGITSTTWSLVVPANLEGEYQIDLRGTDGLGNELVSPKAWRGIIDTQAPGVTFVRTESGWGHTSNTGVRFEHVKYDCVATDRYLIADGFTCPGVTLTSQATRGFNTDPLLQSLFPDRTLLDQMENTTYRYEVGAPLETIEACDLFGHCTTASSGQIVAAAQARAVTDVVSTAAVGEPQALVISPIEALYVASSGDLPVTIAAEAAASLQQVTVELVGSEVKTLTFDQSDNITNTQQTVVFLDVSEGAHTLVAKATDWANVTQTTLYPVNFTLDKTDPAVTLDTDLLRLADTWALGSDMLRFKGTASDSVGLAAVQIKIGDAPFVEATFGVTGTWATAQLVPDPEGKSLAVTVRAIDKAGRITPITGAIGVDLTPTETTIVPPNTTITPTVVNAGVNSVTASFAGVAETNEVAAFECRLDGGPFKPCASPQQYDGLNNGVNLFEVRAIDDQGFVDLTPASETWTIAVTALQTTIAEQPSDPTVSRDANFVFSGANAFECALDGAAYTTCSSPQSYTGLRDGEHTFLVRGLDGSNNGAATRFTWTVVNAAPVANSQTLTVTENSAVDVTLTATDADPLTYKVGSPTFGVLRGVPPAVTYQPDSGYFGTDSFTFVANDGLVNSNVATVTLTIESLDRDAPTTTITLSPDVPTGLNGWYTSTITVTVSAFDGDDLRASGVAETRCALDPATPPMSFDEFLAGCDYAGAGSSVATDGQHTTYAASRDARNNRETPVSKGFQIDMTAPTISAAGIPTANGAGWNNSDVTVQFSCNDAASGVASCTDDQVVTNEAAEQIVSGAVTDNAGNTAATTLSVSLDKTAPTISASIVPTPNGAGWSNSDVTVQFTCADTLSGVASCAAEQAVTAEGANQPITGDATDIADNAASIALTVSVDKTPPTITCSANPDRLWPPNNKLKNINVAVNVEDALSGPDGFVLVSVTNDETTDPNDMPGWEIGTADTAGQLKASRDGNGDGRIYTLTYEGVDVAGNTALCSTIVFVPHDQEQPNPPPPNVAGQEATPINDTTVPEDEVSIDPEEENGPESGNAIFLPLIQR